MANKTTLTTESRTIQVELTYYAPSAVVPPLVDVPLGTTYCVLASVDPWEDDNNPPSPDTSLKGKKQFFKNVFAAKKISSNDISPVVLRIDWTNGTVYDTYRDDIDILEKDADGFLVNHFYAKNRYDQVFKCLWNGANPDNPQGVASTDEPYFQPGTYGTNNIYTATDGYKWKYMYTIDAGLKVKFMDNTWMPIPVGTNTPNPDMNLNSAGLGDIQVINVFDGGTGYDPINNPITVTVNGDGVGASGTAQVTDGVITDITVSASQTGNNYSYASVTISAAAGSGAIAYANTSPVGGHGFDPVSEMGCSHVMMTATFAENMSNQLATDITYHQIGLVISPSDTEVSPYPASDDFYNTTTQFVVAPGFDVYQSGEVVFQSTATSKTLDTAVFTAKVLSFDTSTNVLQLINITGSPITNAPVLGDSTKTTRTLLSVNPPKFINGSGYLAYMENRSGVERSADGIEQFKIVLGY